MTRAPPRATASRSCCNTTALVHEAYLRMADRGSIEVSDRGQFLAVAAQAMRRVLVDHARRYQAHKRGGRAVKVPFDEDVDSFAGMTHDEIAAVMSICS